MSAPAASGSHSVPKHEAFYGFVESPFTLAPDARFLYPSESHADALRQLAAAIRRNEGVLVLTGDAGSGKTTLCRALIEQLDATMFVSLVHAPFASAEDFLRDVLADFGVVSRQAARDGRLTGATRQALADTLRDFLTSLTPINGRGVLIVDDAEQLSPPLLEEIRLLSTSDAGGAAPLQAVLAGEPKLLELLATPELRHIDQRISLRVSLAPLGRDAVDAYVSHRMSVARGASAVTFEPAAIDRLHAISGGIPRVVNLLCDRALRHGAEQGASAISAGMIQDAAAALGVQTTEPAVPRQPRIPRWLLAASIALLVLLVALLVVMQSL